MKNRFGKSPFKSKVMRGLSPQEGLIRREIIKLDQGMVENVEICRIPGFVTEDGKERSLILNREILEKVTGDHGIFSFENLIISSQDWEYAIKNVRNISNRINLIKIIPGTENFLVVGAFRINGYLAVTHFEVISKNGRELKNLLEKGDTLDRSGRTPSLVETGLPSC